MLLWWCTVAGDVDARGQQSDQNVGIRFSTIGGDVTIKQNEAAHIYLEENLIAADLLVIANHATDPAFGIFVFNNEVGGNLLCVANDPTAVVFGNIVAGHSHVDD